MQPDASAVLFEGDAGKLQVVLECTKGGGIREVEAEVAQSY